MDNAAVLQFHFIVTFIAQAPLEKLNAINKRPSFQEKKRFCSNLH